MSTRMGTQPSEVECVGAVLCFLLGVPLFFHNTFGLSAGPALLPVLVLAGSALGLAWLVRVGLLVARRRRGAFSEHKKAWLLLPVLAALLAAVSFLAGWFERGAVDFEQDRWQSVSQGSSDIIRWRMTGDLERNHLKAGMPLERVLSLLGPPDAPAWKAPRMFWWLRKDEATDQSWWLEVRFEDGRMQGSSVRLN